MDKPKKPKPPGETEIAVKGITRGLAARKCWISS